MFDSIAVKHNKTTQKQTLLEWVIFVLTNTMKKQKSSKVGRFETPNLIKRESNVLTTDHEPLTTQLYMDCFV